MPKMKTRRAAAKRIKRTGGGKFKRNRAGHRHGMINKDRTQNRRLRGSAIVARCDEKAVRGWLPYQARGRR
ncbi:MAG: 50S ribosomal protein L35 [Myxococcota bacterium]